MATARQTLRPSQRSLEVALQLAERVYNREAQVRRGFLERPDAEDDKPTPLALLLRSGRGSDIRLKLYLSLLWSASSAPYDVDYPARSWAALLGMEDEEGNGARQIRSALRWLASRSFIALTENPGMPSEVVLLNEIDGTEYQQPGEAIAAARRVRKSWPDSERYFRIPPDLWTKGWASVLSGTALAMLLILFASEREPGEELWFSPRYAIRRFGLSDSARSDGLRELASYGLVEVKRRAVYPDTFDYRRMRNAYVLQRDVLEDGPEPDAVAAAMAPATQVVES